MVEAKSQICAIVIDDIMDGLICSKWPTVIVLFSAARHPSSASSGPNADSDSEKDIDSTGIWQLEYQDVKLSRGKNVDLEALRVTKVAFSVLGESYGNRDQRALVQVYRERSFPLLISSPEQREALGFQ